MVIIANQRSWNHTFKSAHKPIRTDARSASIAFYNIARKASRQYSQLISPVSVTTASGDTLIVSDEVRFDYWTYNRDSRRSRSPLPEANPTHYARFYLDNSKNQLKVDYGLLKPYLAHQTTQILADNVVDCRFNTNELSYVQMSLTLNDPEDNKTITVNMETLMHN